MQYRVSRRSFLAAVTTGVLVAWRAGSDQQKIPIVVYKDRNCGCCGKWVEHMAASGFAPEVNDHPDMGVIKARYHVPPRLQSCHTTIAGEYVIEGHVPAADVRKLLAEKPAGLIGLTIPGMPASAPGMDLTPFQPYTVLTFDGAGNTGVFAQHDRG